MLSLVEDNSDAPHANRRWSLRPRIAALLALPVVAGAVFWAGAATSVNLATQPAEVLTAVVEVVEPSTTVSLAGVIQRKDAVTASWVGTDAAVITATPVAVGAHVGAGSSLAEVNGRPILLLPGALPMYRDIRPGMIGPDVGQLSAALASLGYLTATTNEYTPDVAAAVRDLYAAAGYAPPIASSDVTAELEARKAELRSMEANRSSGSSRLELQVARDRASRNLQLARQAQADLVQSQADEGTQSQPSSKAAVREANEAVTSASEQLALAVMSRDVVS